MKIAIVGLGWLGEPLAHRLSSRYKVVGSKRAPSPFNHQVNQEISCYQLTLPIETLLGKHIELGCSEIKNNLTIQGLFLDTACLVITLPASRTPSVLANYETCVKQLVNLAQLFGVKHTIFTSSTSVYGESVGVYQEESQCNPVSAPGKVLARLEEWLKDTLKEKITILRLAGLAGATRHPGRFFQNSETSSLLDEDSLVNFVHGEDVITAIESIIDTIFSSPSACKKPLKPIYNLCAPIHPSRKRFYAKAAASLGLPAPIFKQNNAKGTDFPFSFEQRVIDGMAITRDLNFWYSHPNPLTFKYTHTLK